MYILINPLLALI